MKWLKRIALVLLVLIVLLVVAFNIWGGKLVRNLIQTGGPAVLGVPVKVESIDYKLLRGLVRVKGFVIGNPEGFKTEKAISVDEILVEFVPKSIFSDTLIIKRVYVDAPDITYELGLGKSNIGRMLEGMEGPKDEGEKEEEPAPAEEKKSGGKKVIIEDLLVENGRVRLSATLAGGAAAPIPLPSVHMTDVGKEEEGGASVVDVVKKVFGAIFKAVTDVVTGAVGLVGDGAKAVGGATVDAGKAVGGAVGAAGGAVGDGAAKVVDGVKGLFKSDDEAETR